MDRLLKATAVVVLTAPLVLSLPTAPEAPAVSEGYEELSTYFGDDLAAANDSEAQDGANRVLTGFGHSFGNGLLGSYPGYPQGGGFPFNQWQYNDGYYNPGYQYQKNCARYCPGSAPGSYVCCVPSEFSSVFRLSRGYTLYHQITINHNTIPLHNSSFRIGK